MNLKLLLQQPQVKEIILRNYNVACIYLAGSRTMGLEDEDSDYDLVALTDGYTEQYPDAWMKNETNIIHWYYNDYRNWYNLTTEDFNKYCGMLQFYFVNRQDLLYENPKYKELIDFLYSNKQQLANWVVLLIYYEYHFFIKEILKANFNKGSKVKILYQLAVCSYVINQEPLEIEFLKRIKHIKANDITDADKVHLIERFTILDNWVKSHKEFIEQCQH